jgi:hypothetical protein
VPDIGQNKAVSGSRLHRLIRLLRLHLLPENGAGIVPAPVGVLELRFQRIEVLGGYRREDVGEPCVGERRVAVFGAQWIEDHQELVEEVAALGGARGFSGDGFELEKGVYFLHTYSARGIPNRKL